VLNKVRSNRLTAPALTEPAVQRLPRRRVNLALVQKVLLFEEPPMHLLRNTLATLCLLATTLAAQAVDLKVAVSGNFNLPPLSAGPGSLTLTFNVTDPIAGATPEGEEAFSLTNLAIAATFDSTAVLSVQNSVAWFAYASDSYFGFDVRLRNLLVPGDVLQMIVGTSAPLYSGTSSAPVLDLVSLTGLGGILAYYPTGFGGSPTSGPLSNTSYAVTPVPEPAAAWLLVPGLMVLGGLCRRRVRAA